MKDSKLKKIVTIAVLESVLILVLSIKLDMHLETVESVLRWADVFKGILPLSVVGAIGYVLWMMDLNGYIVKGIAWLNRILHQYYNEIFLFVLWSYLILYEIYYAYCIGIYISPDSVGYLKEAEALLTGYGFNIDGLAGYETWFASWPIGYPALIAAIGELTGRNIYLCSKIVAIISVGLGILIIQLKFKKRSWIYGLVFLNQGFLTIYCFTWSETPFILMLIMWGIALSMIFQDEIPSKYWYVILAISMLGASLMRYFGVFTVAFTGILLFMFIMKYWNCEKKNHCQLSKIKAIIISEFVAVLGIVFYYLNNKFNSGTFTGVDRAVWWDDYEELISNLYDALIIEFFNATRITIPRGIQEMDVYLKALFILAISSYIAILVYKQIKRNIDYKVVFILAGIAYDILFIIVRFHSSMDPFGYRFFVPGTVLISIGIIGFIQEKMSKQCFRGACYLGTVVLMIMSMSLIDKIGEYKDKTTNYRSYENGVLSELSQIPKQAAVLNFDGEYSARFFRSDLNLDAKIEKTDTMEDVFTNYEQSKYLCIQTNVLQQIIQEGCTKSVREYFDEYVFENDGKKYIIISMETRQIME